MLLFLASLALAHVPHDTVVAVATPATGPWWLLADPSGTRLLLRSDDRGGTFTFAGGAPLADLPDALVTLDDGTVVLVGGRLWWGDGASWSTVDLPARVSLAWGGDTLVLAGRDGVWEGRPGALDRVVVGASITALGPGPSALAEDGSVYTRASGWVGVAGPEHALAVAAGDGEVYVGDAAGGVWRLGEGWEPCGALPASDHPEIVNLALAGETLLVATAARAPYVSVDHCATWTDRGTPQDVTWYGSGGADQLVDAYPVLDIDGGRWLVGGWMGLWWSDDAGETWSEPPLIPPDYTRGLDFSGDAAGRGRYWFAPYGSGPGWTDDGGLTYASPGHGLTEPNVQRVAVSPADPDVVYAVVNHLGWVSRDAGESWTVLWDAATSVSHVLPVGTGDEVWMGAQGADPGLVVSPDAGVSWARLDTFDAAAAGATPGALSGVAAGGIDIRCVRVSDPLGAACTWDAGATWAVLTDAEGTTGDEEDGRGCGVTYWPPDAPTRLVWADTAGVHRSDDRLASSTIMTPTGDDVPIVLTTADDGTIFLATRSGALWRSDDGGETWVDLGVTVPAWVHAMLARPGFAVHRDLLLATHDGMYRLDDTTGTLGRWARWQRIDDRADALVCPDCPAGLDDPAWSMDSIQGVPVGVSARAWLRGTHLRLLGTAADGSARLTVDGASLGLLAEDSPGELGAWELADGWHEIRIDGLAGEGVWIDALEMTGPGDVLVDAVAEDPVEPGETGADGDTGADDDTGAPPAKDGCGCSSGSGSPAWLGLLALATLRRATPRAASRPGARPATARRGGTGSAGSRDRSTSRGG